MERKTVPSCLDLNDVNACISRSSMLTAGAKHHQSKRMVTEGKEQRGRPLGGGIGGGRNPSQSGVGEVPQH